MRTLIENINQILAEWDPIGVGKTIATDEYRGYVPIIIKFIDDKQLLMNCLIDILANKIGLEYDPSNKLHVESVHQVCEKILFMRIRGFNPRSASSLP